MNATPRLDERGKQARAEQHSEAFLNLDSPLNEVQRMADLTMSWWHMYTEKHDMKVLGQPGVHFSEREIEVMSFALGNIWERLRDINAVYEQPYAGDAMA